MNLAQREYLKSLLESELFADVLRSLADFHRPNILPLIVSAHTVQNTQAAAVNAGALDTIERLPDFFLALLESQFKSDQ